MNKVSRKTIEEFGCNAKLVEAFCKEAGIEIEQGRLDLSTIHIERGSDAVAVKADNAFLFEIYPDGTARRVRYASNASIQGDADGRIKLRDE